MDLPAAPKTALKAEDIAIGERIRLRRKAFGLSQEGLAIALGITFQQVQKYEKGTNRTAATRLRQIAKALNTSVADLMGLDNDAEGLATGRARALEFETGSRRVLKFIDAAEKNMALARIELQNMRPRTAAAPHAQA